MRGPIALVGGAEFLPPAAPLDAWLLERSGSPVVTVLPTASYEHPEMAVATARRHFASLGGDVEGAMILTRADADDPASRERLAPARFIYIAGGDPRYLLAVLRQTAAWAGVLEALDAGGVLAGSSAGAMVLCDRMLVPGSPAAEPALGLLEDLVVLVHHNRWRDRLSQAGAAAGETRLLGVDEGTGLVLEDGTCRVLGDGSVTLYRSDGASGTRAPVALWTCKAPAELERCLR